VSEFCSDTAVTAWDQVEHWAAEAGGEAAVSGMVERVARALERSAKDQDRHSAEDMARAAIAAMREPTAEMMVAGGPMRPGSCWHVSWQDMIDAALEP